MPRFEPHPDRRPAVVTGASSGIGDATARALAAAGHPVVLGARRLEVCEAIAAEIRADGGEAVALALDLADPSSVDSFAGLCDVHGPVEVLVSNAGEVLPTTTVATDPDVFATQVQVNLLGAQRLLHHLVPPMITRRRGDVVLVTSDVVENPRPRMASYVASKWGLEGLARALQKELEGTGVRASILRPGPASTGQGSTWDPAEIDTIIDEWTRWGFMRHPGYLRPREIADVVVHMVGTPRGTHLAVVEIQPEAPVVPPAEEER